MKVLSALFLSAAVAAAGSTRILSEEVNTYCTSTVVTDWGGIIYVNEQGGLSIINPDYTGEPGTFVVDLGRELTSWGGTGQVMELSGSSDGRMICYAQFVHPPEDMDTAESCQIPSPLIVVCCGSDGMAPKVVGLSFDVGGGPQFDFTQDSRYVYGDPWIECSPSPEGYLYYFQNEGQTDIEPFLMVETTSGERSGDPSPVSDGYMPNPYSDLVAAGWYPPNAIVEITSGRVLLQDTSSTPPSIIDTWVLPDAGLALLEDGRQVLRYSNGTEVVNPGERLYVYGRLQDGRYIFTRDGGENVMLGSVDWSDFTIGDSVPIPWLDGLYPETMLHELPGGEGVVYSDGGSLVLAELP